MEVQVLLRHQDFNFDSATSSPYVTAPSSPQLFGFAGDAAAIGGGYHHFYNLSAPASPTGTSSAFFRRELIRSRKYSIPFDWEEKPGIPKSEWGSRAAVGDGDDFEFDFSGRLDIGSCVSATADELFDGGKIRPLKLPPRLQVGAAGEFDTASLGASPRTPVSRSRFSPKKRVAEKKKEVDDDPFTKALEEQRKTKSGEDQHRGRDRNPGSSSSSSSNYTRRATRSLSPFRVSDTALFHDPPEPTAKPENPNKPNNYFSSLISSISLSSRAYRNWSFKDFLLFRSASEGRGTSSDPLRKKKYYRETSSVAEDSASFRSMDSMESSVSRKKKYAEDSGSFRRRQSAHEVHYKVNRAASEEMRRKTFLPYKQGLLGCLGFNPAVHELARGIGSLTRGSS